MRRLMDPDARESRGALQFSAVLVVPNPADVAPLTLGLSPSEFRVTVLHNFADAKAFLDVQPPDLLITELRLGEYNGLHLVLRGKAARSDMAALVLSDLEILQSEAERLGATFIVKPISSRDLAAAVVRTLHRHEDAPPVRPPYERRSADRRQAGSSKLPLRERRTGERRRAFFPKARVELA